MALTDDCTEDEKQISENIQALSRWVVSFGLQFMGNEVTKSQAQEENFVFSVLLENVKLIKTEISLIELKRGGHLGQIHIEGEIAALHEGLNFLKTFFLLEEEASKQSKMFFSEFVKLAYEVTSLISSIHANRRTGKITIENNLALILCLEKLKLFKSEVHLMELQNRNANWMLPMKDEIDMLLEGLAFLRTYLTDSKDIEDQTEEGYLFFASVQAATTESSSLISSFCLNEFREEKANEFSLQLPKLVKKIKLIKAEVVLTKLLNHETNAIVHVKDQIQKLLEDLRFFKSFLMDPPREYKEDGEMILRKVEEIVNEEATLICTIRKADKTVQIKFPLSELQKKVMDLKGEIRQIYLHVSQSLKPKHPRTDGLGFISSLLFKLKELQNHKADSIASGKHQIEMLVEKLDVLRSFLIKIVEHHQEQKELKHLWICVTDIAHEAENVIDSFVVRAGPLWYRMLRLTVLIEEINAIKAKVMETKSEKRLPDTTRIAKNMPSKTSSAMNGEVVGYSDEAENIIGRLTRGSEQLDIVPIIGMPGIGKTTLAKRVYNDLSVTYHFHIRAWCCISQVYQKRELLLDILGDIVELTNRIHEMSAEDIAHQLYKQLSKQRYLIVMDDLWDIGALKELILSFPNDSNGSRVLFTSRLHDVASPIKLDCAPHHLRLLSDDESWELFQKKVFHEESFPEELIGVGKVIASNCKGLPLSVVVIAGLLGRTEKKLDWWKTVSQSLSFQVFADPERQCRRVLELSYNHLPDHLKSCFLYFGAFPANEEVPTPKLLWLWIAEGFIHTCKSKSLEDSAEECLLDLIARSLVTVAKRRSDGGVKACCIHDLLRVLSVEKAKEENFLELIDGFDQFLATTGEDFDRYPSYPLIYEQRRLSICSRRKDFTTLKPQGPCVRSLLFFASNDAKPRMLYDISFICHNFKLISVLDLERINMGSSFPAGLELLVLLRYLSVRGEIRSIPSSVTTLWNLETLLVKGLRGEITLPASFWKMASLRHVHINDRVAFSSEFNELENASMLDNVTTLSTPVLYPGEWTEKMMRRLPRLRKLSCIFSVACDGFPKLDFLSDLESLKVIYCGERYHRCLFKLPLNIKKLTLSKFRLPWSEISTIGKLPNLEVLKLLFRAFEGEEWEMGDEFFPELKFLKLDTLDIVQWNASDDHFPKLQRLVLKSCKKLKQVPQCLGEREILEVIEQVLPGKFL